MVEQPQQQNFFGGFEKSLGQAIYSGTGARAYTDKLMAAEEDSEIKDLIQKDNLDGSDLRRLGYMLASKEQKLVNYDDKERYLLGKYKTWIDRAISLQQTRLRNMIILKSKNVTEITELSLKQAYQIHDEDIKKMISLFLYISRSSLSLNAKAFNDLSTNKAETVYQYNQIPGYAQP